MEMEFSSFVYSKRMPQSDQAARPMGRIEAKRIPMNPANPQAKMIAHGLIR